MADGPDHPMAIAMQWVSRVFAASLMMVLPGIAGQWLDGRWDLVLFGPAGFVLGLVGGMAYLIAVTRRADVARRTEANKDAADSAVIDSAVKNSAFTDNDVKQGRRGQGPRAPQ